MTADAERTRRLWDQVKHLRFWCEQCHGCHPLAEHAACRTASVTAIAARARRDLGGHTP